MNSFIVSDMDILTKRKTPRDISHLPTQEKYELLLADFNTLVRQYNVLRDNFNDLLDIAWVTADEADDIEHRDELEQYLDIQNDMDINDSEYDFKLDAVEKSNIEWLIPERD